MPDQNIAYVARLPFLYAGTDLDQGQMLASLGGHPNDEKLTRLGYLTPVAADADPCVCAFCGAQFVDQRARTMHGDKRHTGRAAGLLPDVPISGDPAMEDAVERRADAQLMATAPLNFSAAGQGPKGGRK